MDEETRAAFAALMARINNNHEAVLHRLSAVEGAIRDLTTSHEVTRRMVTSLPATVLGAIEEPMLKRLGDLEHRVTKLENGKDAA